MHEEFLPNDIESPSTEVSIEVPTDPVSRQEFVKVMVVGSRQGIDIIIGLLHRLYFAEVREWSPPTPYGKSGEVMSLMRKKVSLN
jgi:hypothetical protein